MCFFIFLQQTHQTYCVSKEYIIENINQFFQKPSRDTPSTFQKKSPAKTCGTRLKKYALKPTDAYQNLKHNKIVFISSLDNPQYL